jgi:hypothetical protein
MLGLVFPRKSLVQHRLHLLLGLFIGQRPAHGQCPEGLSVTRRRTNRIILGLEQRRILLVGGVMMLVAVHDGEDDRPLLILWSERGTTFHRKKCCAWGRPLTSFVRARARRVFVPCRCRRHGTDCLIVRHTGTHLPSPVCPCRGANALLKNFGPIFSAPFAVIFLCVWRWWSTPV